MYLDLISGELHEWIRKVNAAPDFPDNIARTQYLSKIMAKYGFTLVGSGTNRAVYKHHDTYNEATNSDVVFKIALDSRGILDNEREHDLYVEAPAYVIEKNYFIEVFEKSDDDLVLVSRAAHKVMDVYDEKAYRPTLINTMFTELDEDYLLDDMDTTNLGLIEIVKYDGSTEVRVTIIDSANLEPKENLHLFCTSRSCEGIDNEDTYLIYTSDMKQMICPRCGAHYTFADIKKTKTGASDFEVQKAFMGKKNQAHFGSGYVDPINDAVNWIMNHDPEEREELEEDMITAAINRVTSTDDYFNDEEEEKESIEERRKEMALYSSYNGKEVLRPSQVTEAMFTLGYYDEDEFEEYEEYNDEF